MRKENRPFPNAIDELLRIAFKESERIEEKEKKLDERIKHMKDMEELEHDPKGIRGKKNDRAASG